MQFKNLSNALLMQNLIHWIGIVNRQRTWMIKIKNGWSVMWFQLKKEKYNNSSLDLTPDILQPWKYLRCYRESMCAQKLRKIASLDIWFQHKRSFVVETCLCWGTVYKIFEYWAIPWKTNKTSCTRHSHKSLYLLT